MYHNPLIGRRQCLMGRAFGLMVVGYSFCLCEDKKIRFALMVNCITFAKEKITPHIRLPFVVSGRKVEKQRFGIWLHLPSIRVRKRSVWRTYSTSGVVCIVASCVASAACCEGGKRRLSIPTI